MDECEAEAARRRISFAPSACKSVERWGCRRRWSAATLTQSTQRFTVPSAWSVRSMTGGACPSRSRLDADAEGVDRQATATRVSAARPTHLDLVFQAPGRAQHGVRERKGG